MILPEDIRNVRELSVTVAEHIIALAFTDDDMAAEFERLWNERGQDLFIVHAGILGL